MEENLLTTGQKIPGNNNVSHMTIENYLGNFCIQMTLTKNIRHRHNIKTGHGDCMAKTRYPFLIFTTRMKIGATIYFKEINHMHHKLGKKCLKSFTLARSCVFQTTVPILTDLCYEVLQLKLLNSLFEGYRYF